MSQEKVYEYTNDYINKKGEVKTRHQVVKVPIVEKRERIKTEIVEVNNQQYYRYTYKVLYKNGTEKIIKQDVPRTSKKAKKDEKVKKDEKPEKEDKFEPPDNLNDYKPKKKSRKSKKE
ncbi:hypothetical protein IKS57_02220 [bacterium]|nr:hypothetical protein [bacterium]